MIEMRRFKAGVLEYANREILPKMDPTRQFVAGVVLGLASNKMEAMLSKLAENELVKMLGIVEGDQVDLDAIHNALQAQFAKQPVLPVDIPMMGRINFRAEDASTLFQIINGMP